MSTLPFHGTWTDGLFGGDQELEGFRDTDDSVHLQACSAFGEIADRAIHHRGLTIKNNFSRLERSLPFLPAPSSIDPS
jgi:hypothetical protein